MLCNPWENFNPEWKIIDSLDNAQVFLKVSCYDSNNCCGLATEFVKFNNYVKITHDAGNNWVYALKDTYFIGSKDKDYTDKYYPTSANDISYISHNIIILALDSGRIMRTEDTGKTWVKFQLPVKNKLIPVVNIKFVNENVGIANAVLELFLTTDKGINWNKINLDLKSYSPKLKAFSDVWLTDENNIFLSCIYDTSLPNGWEFGIQNYFHSTNQGKDWKYLNGKTEFGAIIQFINNKVGYSTGGDKDPKYWYYHTSIYKTTNGGDSWNRIFYDDSIDYQVSYMKFYDEENGIVITDHNIYKTADGGITWNKTGVSAFKQLNGFYRHRGISWRTKSTPLVASGFYMFEYQTPTDVHERKDMHYLNISPNPVNDYIEISQPYESFKPLEGYTIRIYDVLGMEVQKSMDSRLRGNDSHFPEASSVRIDVSQLAPGMYFVRVGDIVQKFVKY